MRKAVVILFAVFLASCASLIAESPAQRVYAAQADFNGLLTAAVAYESQPRCTEGQSQLDGCSDPDAVEALRLGYRDVQAALQAAQKTVRDPAANEDNIELALIGAAHAIQAFRVILTNHQIMGVPK